MYVFIFRFDSVGSLVSDGSPQVCRSWMGHVGLDRSPIRHVEVSDGYPIRHIVLWWVSDNNNIFVNSFLNVFDFRGFCTGLMANSLKLLNLNGNKIKLLPNYFCQLRQLVTLSMNKNELTLLPPSFGKLKLLKHLSVCDNHLKILPGSFSSLR